MERHPPERLFRRRLEITRTMGYLAIQQATDAILTAMTAERRMLFTDAWWQKQRSTAEAFMAERRAHTDGGVLLIAAAQHPLKDGRIPGPEFAARLLAMVTRAKELATQGVPVDIYIPGSRHMHEDIADEVSLSAPGVAFVHEQDLPTGITVYGDDLNQRYKGDDGVYNSADEAFVGISYFKDTPTLRDIEVFCSPGQQARWELHAIAGGALPTFTPVSPEGVPLYHAAPGNNQDKVAAYTRRLDPTWQSPKSFLGQATRLLRKPPQE